jgi:PAS domain S-box-containing protein
MARKHGRGGIERRFLSSILWVGIIPMALAMIIGYVFAREGQQIAVRQELNTAVRTTAGGVWTALQAQLQFIQHIAHDPVVLAALHAARAGETPDVYAVMRRLPTTPLTPDDMPTAYTLYSPEGEVVVHTGPVRPPEKRPEWMGKLTEAAYTGFSYIGETGQYANHIATPIIDPDTQDLLGYLAVIQGVKDLLEYVLGRGLTAAASGADANRYELIYMTPRDEFVVYMDETAASATPPPRFNILDTVLADRLRRNGHLDFDSFTQWRFKRGGKTMSALMAYHRLLPQHDLYLLAYRPSSAVFANLNLAAGLTLLVSSLVIGLFCIIAYRIVNNNIIRPVSLLNEGAQIIRQGDLELKLKIHTGDEIEELASSFNKMAAALRQNISRLEASEERYRSLFSSMRDGIFRTDPQGAITLINPAGVEILGFSRQEEAIGKTIGASFERESEYQQLLDSLAEKAFIERTRVWMLKPGAGRICVELALGRVFDESGAFAGYEGTLRDVTQNVRLEQESRERSERITAINQIANVINSSLEAGRVYENIVVEVRKLVTFDYAAVALLKEDGIGFRTLQLWPEPPEDERPLLREDGENSCAAWVAREQRCLIVSERAASAVPLDGQFPDYVKSCLCVPLYATGRIVGVLNLGAERPQAFTQHEVDILEQMAAHVAVAIRNATLLENLQHSLEEVTRAREKLHAANEELKTLDEMKTNLLSNVSHELRTPLVAVMGYTDMILKRKAGNINELQEEYLSISLRNIERLVNLIENLLDFSKIHRGESDLVFDTMDLVDCARSSLQMIRPIAESKRIALAIEAPDFPVFVEGDKAKLGQVFNNLLSNGVKFNHPGGTVTISITVNDGLAEVMVSDTGIGIPEEALGKIFSRFYQVDSSSTRKYGGTGIGLAIAQDIMRMHGSNISVTSELGKGTRFRFTMTLSPVMRSDVEKQDYIRPLPTETHQLIELVSQDRALSNQIRAQLVSEGMDVIHAASTSLALELMNKYNPDCVLLDSEAGPLGSVVINSLIGDPSMGGVPIILLTDDDNLHRMYESRVAGRIRRNFNKSTLLSSVHYALTRGLPLSEQLGNKVLCVDDDPDIARFISRCLGAEGFETDQCRTGEEALDLVKSRDYWLVLLDIAMPGMDGWETCRRLKADPTLSGLRIYMVTAKPMDKSLARVHECGADGFLQKPFRAEELLAVIEGYEWRRRAMRGGNGGHVHGTQGETGEVARSS